MALASSSVTSTSSYSMPLAPSSALALAQYGHHSIEYISTRAIGTSSGPSNSLGKLFAQSANTVPHANGPALRAPRTRAPSGPHLR